MRDARKVEVNKFVLPIAWQEVSEGVGLKVTLEVAVAALVRQELRSPDAADYSAAVIEDVATKLIVASEKNAAV